MEQGSRAGELNSCKVWTLEHRLNPRGPWAELLYGKCSLPGSEVELCLLHWQAGSLPLSHQGRPCVAFSVVFKRELLVLMMELYLQNQENDLFDQYNQNCRLTGPKGKGYL